MLPALMEQFVTAAAGIFCLALVPGSFVGAYFLGRKWIKSPAGRVFFTLGVGVVILVAGVVGAVAGCSSLYSPNFH